MIKLKIKNSPTKIILSKGEFYLDNCDIIINWVSPELVDGPYCSKRLLENAGEQFSYNLFCYKHLLKSGDTFTSHAGLLPASLAINCVMPLNKEMYNDCFFRIKDTILKYHTLDNLSRFITLTIPDTNFKEFIYFFDTYFKQLKFVREFRIIIENDFQFIEIKKELKKYYKEEISFADYITNFLKRNEFTTSRRKKLSKNSKGIRYI